jgi:3-oxoadipate enol-lactonase
MPTASVNGIDLYYETTGSGPRLLFVNGSGATLANNPQSSGAFSGAFEVVAFDQRGLGRSASLDQAYTMADLAADALALADHLGWETFRLAGVSFGGMVAQEMAVTAPERIDRLALICTSPGGAGGSSFPLHTLADLNPVERAAVSVQILDTRFTPGWLESHEEDRMLAQLLAQHFATDKPDAVRRGEALQLAARSAHDVFDRLPRITCPTLVASGRYDGIAPPENGAAIAARIPGTTLRVFEGGHLFLIQDTTAFPAIVEFLERD